MVPVIPRSPGPDLPQCDIGNVSGHSELEWQNISTELIIQSSWNVCYLFIFVLNKLDNFTFEDDNAADAGLLINLNDSVWPVWV